jgi:two-component system CheB/CheR fusion protein
MDPQGVVLWCNSGAQRVFNAPLAALVGKDLSSIFTQEDRDSGIDELERVVASTAAISEDDRWHLRADGSRFWSSGALFALRDADDRLVGYGKILRDRTDAKEQAELLGSAIKSLEASNAAKDLAITKVAHELRNVFAGINMGLQLISNRRGSGVDADIADLMHRQLQMLERLTEDLLETKRLSASKVTLNLDEVPLQEVLRDVAGQLQGRCAEKSLNLQILTPPVPIVVAADRVRLQQVFANLVDNAIKYTPAGGQIWVKMTTEDRHAVIHVEDNGRGIPAEMLTKIFDMFTQVDANASSEGLGLGLALVHELVQLHGGSVQAASKGLGMGSEFSVRLPLAGHDSIAGIT